MEQIPYFKQQATKLLDTGACDLPLTHEDLAGKVARHPSFAHAVRGIARGDFRMITMLTEIAAHELCKEQDHAA